MVDSVGASTSHVCRRYRRPAGHSQETGASQTAVTNANGSYHLYNVPAPATRHYSLTSRASRGMCFPTFTWALGRTNEIHATLQLGSVSETVNVMAEATTVQASSAMVSSALSKQAANAKGKGVGEMFDIASKQKITIGKNQSARVPILQSHITPAMQEVFRRVLDQKNEASSLETQLKSSSRKWRQSPKTRRAYSET